MKSVIGNNGKDKRVRANAFEKIPLFTEHPTSTDDVKILGLYNEQRTSRYIQLQCLSQDICLDNY